MGYEHTNSHSELHGLLFFEGLKEVRLQKNMCYPRVELYSLDVAKIGHNIVALGFPVEQCLALCKIPNVLASLVLIEAI